MRFSIFLFALLFPAGASAQSHACPDAAAIVGRLEQPAAAIRYLADDALHGRLAGSPGERCAAQYIAARFDHIGLDPGGSDGGYFQSVHLSSAINPHAPSGQGRNVVGLLPGTHPDLRDEAVVIGAHYDHLGTGGFGSLAPGEEAIHNGADDNASGVGALLRVAELLADRPLPRTVVFVAFTGEEFGLIGSAHYASHPVVPLDRTTAMLNMDMVGRLADRPLILYGSGTAEEWPALLERVARDHEIRLSINEEGFGPSDHTSFYGNEVPVLHFFTNAHEDYHRPSDDWQKIDTEGVEHIARLVADVAADLGSRHARLTLLRGAGAPPAAGEGPGYGAYLGSVPDFTPVERGVRLTGVGPGSPAETAGIRGGDIIVGFGEMDIGDLYDLTAALRAHKPGDTVEVAVLREGRHLVFPVQLASRDER